VAQPGEPRPLRVGAAGALVGDLDDEPAVALGHLDARGRAAPVLGRVGQPLGRDEVGGGLDHRGRTAQQRRLHRDRHRRAPAERLHRGHQAAVGQDRRRDAAGEVAQLADGRPGLLACLAHERGDLGLALEALLGATELHAQGDQAGMRRANTTHAGQK
jgi:hypothetical protein